jgi:F-type H+-transporting ATPase subunit b
MLQLEPGMMIWTWVTFIFLFILLSKIAWKPLLAMVEKRENTINDALKKAEEAQDEAQKILEEQQKKLESAQSEIQEMMKENKALAEKMKNEVIEKAKNEAQKLHDRAVADIERETDAALLDLRKQVADLTIHATSRLIQENLDDKKHSQLIDNYIKELDNLKKN